MLNYIQVTFTNSVRHKCITWGISKQAEKVSAKRSISYHLVSRRCDNSKKYIGEKKEYQYKHNMYAKCALLSN